jgi:ribosomal protein S12 methylthiotransferase
MTRSRVAYISLGCPKALVDSEHIVTELVESGYEIVAGEDDAEVIVVNTCGFINAAKDESYGAIELALQQGREVVVTGCLGADADAMRAKFPALKHVSGPQDVAPVVAAVQSYLPADAPAFGAGRLPGEARAHGAGTRLTPGHYAYLKISEGCNHTCSFCIIPTMRGPLKSRNISDVLREAEGLSDQGVQEVMVIAQDLNAYGADIKYASGRFGEIELPSRLETLVQQLGSMFPWVRLHYVYPYPNVDQLIPLMADGACGTTGSQNDAASGGRGEDPRTDSALARNLPRAMHSKYFYRGFPGRDRR